MSRRPSLRDIIVKPRLAIMMALGCSSGLPLILVFSTQSLWLRRSGVSVEAIGLLSYVLLCYSLKFAWAPLIDTVNLPVLARLLGRRRAWLLASQMGAMVGLFCLSYSDPTQSLRYGIVCSFLTAFAGATQDVVIDGWRIDAAPPDEQGMMSVSYQLGYSIAKWLAGGIALIVAQAFGWGWAYVSMATVMAVGIAACLLSPRLPDRAPRATLGTFSLGLIGVLAALAVFAVVMLPETVGYIAGHRWVQLILLAFVITAVYLVIAAVAVQLSPDVTLTRTAATYAPITIAFAFVSGSVHWSKSGVSWTLMDGAMLVALVGCFIIAAKATKTSPPEKAERRKEAGGTSLAVALADLIRRKGGWIAAIFLLIALYRLPDILSGVMAQPLYADLNFSNDAIALVSKFYGIWISIAGTIAGGIAVARLGLMPALLIGGIAASASHLAFALLATSTGQRMELLTLAISVENFASGFAGTALIAFMSSLTSPLFAATQYALLSSLYALPGKLVGGLSGYMVKAMGYPKFFVLTSLIGIPVAILCLLVWRFARRREDLPGNAVLESSRAFSSGFSGKQV